MLFHASTQYHICMAKGDLIRCNYFIDSFSAPYHCSFPSIKHMPGWIMRSHTQRGSSSDKSPHGVCLCQVPCPLVLSSCSSQPLYNPLPPTPLPFMCPGTQAQQAFRTKPSNLTVQEGATAVLKCDVLRASGTVQWVKDGLLLGPERSLPGFPRYSMIGSPTRGKRTRNKVYTLSDLNGPIRAEGMKSRHL